MYVCAFRHLPAFIAEVFVPVRAIATAQARDTPSLSVHSGLYRAEECGGKGHAYPSVIGSVSRFWESISETYCVYDLSSLWRKIGNSLLLVIESSNRMLGGTDSAETPRFCQVTC